MNLFYLTFCPPLTCDMTLTRGCTHLENKKNLSFQFVSSVVLSTWYTVQSQHLLTSPRRACVPGIQVHPQQSSLFHLLAAERTFSLIICSAGDQHCMMLLSHQGVQKDGNSTLLSITSWGGFQNGESGNWIQFLNSSRVQKHSQFKFYCLV